MAIVRGIHKVSGWLDRIGAGLSLVMLAAMVMITGLQIVCRVFFNALSWSEEAARYLLVWSTFIGASCVYKHAGHISVTFVQGLLPGVGKTVLEILVHVICGAFFAVAVYFGIIYAGKQGGQLSPAIRVPMSYMYAAIPAGGALMLWHAVDAVLQALSGKAAREGIDRKEAEEN